VSCLSWLRSTPRRRAGCLAAIVAGALLAPSPGRAQEPSAPAPVSPERLQRAIDTLSDLDYQTRTDAARLIRRTTPALAAPALLQAVSSHHDGYVRYRALVLLTGFNDARTGRVMYEALSSPNDRLRTVAYRYFERNPDRDMARLLLNALDRELSEFVRPALIGALASLGGDATVRPVLTREVGRGEDFFRSVVIESLGLHKADYAVDAIAAVAKLEGPLQDDAVLALGRIGGAKASGALRDLRDAVPESAQPSVAAALCLIGVECDTQEKYLRETLAYADKNRGFQELLRGAAAGLAALGVAGRASAAQALFDLGVPSDDPTRAPIALGLGAVALRNTPLMLSVLPGRRDQADAIALLAEGFDMLEEDLEKERFFALVRRSYWNAAEGSAERALAQLLIGKLDF
jgi:hypothetical protein